uniref:RING-type domain-containing protein n=1 Tax=Amphilophus citrinellus TaxID=61819 RepID=A0A3Q0RE71_AMPCI
MFNGYIVALCPNNYSLTQTSAISSVAMIYSFGQSQPLPCGHSFCPACVREAWSSQGEGKGRFTCPQCQEEHDEVSRPELCYVGVCVWVDGHVRESFMWKPERESERERERELKAQNIK